MKKLSTAIYLFLLMLSMTTAAPPHLLRNFTIPAAAKVQQLDSLSIIAESFSISGPDSLPLDRAFYEIDFIRARIQLRIPEYWKEDSLQVTYEVWPLNFSSPVFLRDTSLLKLPGPGEDPQRIALRSQLPEQGLLRFEGLQSSGSITRGLTLGNRQDATLNSAMNLQLSGRLTDDIEILAVISDQNIPFQPEGTTQQIQDFDKVFIQLSGHGAKLIAGDFEMQQTPGHFMNLNRKARGASISYASAAQDSLLPGGGTIRSTVAGAISRGKYARNQIQGTEGNQGPYRLRGNDNESFIIVLAGTEKVFVDGILLSRGMENDYIMDYNLAELTFMPLRLITRDSRIIVEFEYAERNYARSMLFTSTELKYEKAKVHVSFFSEQDHPGQPLFQEVTEQRRALMAAVGDSINRAFDWNIDSTGFQNDRVMYRMTDTLGFDSIFVFSIDPENAVYQLGFSFVGEGNGNYRQQSTSANGRVYQWIAPINGTPQGTHEPIIQLVTPGKHQLLSLGSEIRLSPHTTASMEYALSNRDINLFSNLHKDNNIGHALNLALTDTRKGGKAETPAWEYITAFSYEYSGAQFRAPERYREAEFERNWNIQDFTKPREEHLPALSLTAKHHKRGMARYRVHALLGGEDFSGLMNRLDTRIQAGKRLLEYNGSLLNSSGLRQTDFYRHRAAYTHNLRWMQAGIIHQLENNKINLPTQEGLSLLSFSFNEQEFFVSNRTEASNTWRLFYKQRNDFLPAGNSFEKASQSYDYGLQYQHRQNPTHRYSIQLVYRELEVIQQRFPGEQNDRTLNSRLDHFLQAAQGAITSTLFYQAASAMERKREYIYLEVPAGQGIYVWVDYNGNGVMELDEFELSPFPDEANFIRVFIPTDDFVRTYSTNISHSINLEPAALWREEQGWKQFLGRFSNRMNYRIDKKNQGGLAAENLNPFFTSVDDTLLISLGASLRNSLFFNRTHRTYSLEWTIQQASNKSILSNGFESRDLLSHTWRARLSLSRQLSLFTSLQSGTRHNESEFFATRNYSIRFYELEPSLTLQPAQQLRFNLLYAYNQQSNEGSELSEQAIIHKTALEARLNFPSRGSLQLRYQLSFIDFPYDANTPLAFEMLQALQPGTNNLWNINWQQNLNAYLQLTLNYSGRKPPGLQTIHTGSVAVRAFF